MSERRGDWMITYTGRRFWPLDPHPDDVDFRDIAHALSLVCRYGGHVRRFYSVAEHSTLLARYFLDRAEPARARCALVHDMAEAYVGDMVRPLKGDMPAYSLAEAAIFSAIVQALPVSLAPPWEAADEDAVSEIDRRIIANEAAELFRPETLERAGWTIAGDRLPGVVPIGVPPHEAERDFMRLLGALFPGLERTQ